jgi:hypothetical protein
MPSLLNLLLRQGQERSQLSTLGKHDSGSLDVPTGYFLPLELVACLEGVLSCVFDVFVEPDDLVFQGRGATFGCEELLDRA